MHTHPTRIFQWGRIWGWGRRWHERKAKKRYTAIEEEDDRVLQVNGNVSMEDDWNDALERPTVPDRPAGPINAPATLSDLEKLFK